MSGVRRFDSFDRIISPNVPGCPEPTITQFVRAAAIEVCQRTLAWRYEMDPIILTPGIYEYDYDPAASTTISSEVCHVLHAALNDVQLPLVTQLELFRMYPGWPKTATADRSQPLRMSELGPDSFVVAPVPDNATTYSLKLFVALKPTRDATGMDKSVLEEIEREVEHATLQRLYLIPEKSWTNEKIATYHAKQLTFKLAARRAQFNLGAAKGSISVQQRPLA